MRGHSARSPRRRGRFRLRGRSHILYADDASILHDTARLPSWERLARIAMNFHEPGMIIFAVVLNSCACVGVPLDRAQREPSEGGSLRVAFSGRSTRSRQRSVTELLFTTPHTPTRAELSPLNRTLAADDATPRRDAFLHSLGTSLQKARHWDRLDWHDH